jgi:hypothetical protein
MVLETKYNEEMKVVHAQEKKAEQEQKRKSAEYKRQLITKYGATNANKILEGKVEIGWTKEMCKEALFPGLLALQFLNMDIRQSIRQGIKIEVWTVSHRSYTFKNGKLSKIDTY